MKKIKVLFIFVNHISFYLSTNAWNYCGYFFFCNMITLWSIINVALKLFVLQYMCMTVYLSVTKQIIEKYILVGCGVP